MSQTPPNFLGHLPYDTPKHVVLTPEIARYLREHAVYGRQRKLEHRVVDRYGYDIENGQFKKSDLMILAHIRTEPDREYLINGQHRVAAVDKTGISIPGLFERREYESQAEIDEAYSLIDMGNTRSRDARLNSLNLAQELGLRNNALKAIIAASAVIANNFIELHPTSSIYYRTNTNEALRSILYYWQESARDYMACIKGSGQREKLFLRAPVVAVGLVTLKYQRDEAKAFWYTTAHTIGLTQNDPRSALLYVLENRKPADKSPGLYSKSVASAWNNHRKGVQVQKVYGQKGSNIEILGTPWTHESVPNSRVLSGIFPP